MVTQKEMVLQYMQDFGSITPVQAFQDLGIMRLGARIFELKKDGVMIESRLASARNRYGKTVRYSEYRLREGESK